MIEDLHTAYWSDFGGGYQVKNIFFYSVFNLVDDMHDWYHKMGLIEPSISQQCSGIHIHDSIVVLEKNINYASVHSKISGSKQ